MADYPDEVLRLLVRLEQLSRSGDIKVARIMKKLQNQLLDVLYSAGNFEAKSRMLKIRKRMNEIAGARYDEIRATIGQYSETAAEVAIKTEQNNLTLLGEQANQFAEDMVSTKVTERSLDRMLPGLPQGRQITIGQMLDRFVDNGAIVASNVANKAFSEGLSIAQAAKELRGVIEISNSDARSVMRTAVMGSLNQARDDVADHFNVSKNMWLATLDSKTCQFCAGRDGVCDEPGSLPSPPAHPNCRCTILYIPQGTSCSEMKEDMERPFKGPDGKSTRHSPYKDYGEWILTQPEDFQNEILGKERAALLRSGKVAFKQMYLKNGSRLSLVELKKKYGIQPKPKPVVKPKPKPKPTPKPAVKKEPALKLKPKKAPTVQNRPTLTDIRKAIDADPEIVEIKKKMAVLDKNKATRLKKLNSGKLTEARKEDLLQKIFDDELLRRTLEEDMMLPRMRLVRDIITPPKGGKISLKTLAATKKKMKTDGLETWAYNIKATEDLLHPDLLAKLPDVELKRTKKWRAQYMLGQNIIKMGHDSTGTFIHEFGHHIEWNENLYESAKNFRKSRTVGETKTQITPGEWGYEDNFFNHYCGREYSFKGTEIISMGLEQMYKQPEYFFRSDPEYFEFILKIMWNEKP